MKHVHLICNAHIDPVWQWEWEEGAAAAVSTFRCAADFCEENDDYVFCHNEALLYRWIEEYEPTLFARIQKLVKVGKWHIMGGWHLQPDCNMLSGESFVRQINQGRRYFGEKFGKYPTTAINFDPFGHTRGLVQILAKSGFDSYLFTRPSEVWCHLPDNTFSWVGFDGSAVVGQRLETYGSNLFHAAEKIRKAVEEDSDHAVTAVLWGVGDHGGGASRRDIADIAALKKELEKDGIALIHSTPEAYFAEVDKEKLPRVENDLNLWAVGCYTSQIRIKQKHRLAENMLYATERMATHAVACGMEYPAKELQDAEYSLLTAEFHDSLPGSSIQPVEDMAIRQLDHAMEILSRVRARCFYKLSEGQRVAASDEIPILVYNPHPYPVEGDYACEFMLWDQNRNFEFSMPIVYRDGEMIPAQCEKEQSNIPIDWRKRVVFHATLAPMSMNRFDCKIRVLPKKPTPTLPIKDDAFVFDSPKLYAEISRRTGLITNLRYEGKSYLCDSPLLPEVYADNADPWGMTVRGFTEKIGAFSLLSEEESTRFANITEGTLPAVHVIEDGDVRTTVQALFGYGSCRAVLDYHFSKIDGTLTVNVRLIWDEKAKMVKLRVPTVFADMQAYGETAYGEQAMRKGGDENCSLRYSVLHNGTDAVAVLNNGIYGSSLENNDLCLTLLRSPAYTAHPIDDRQIMPQDRYMPYIDQGERQYAFRFLFGSYDEVASKAPRAADAFNEEPMAISFFPAGIGELPPKSATLRGDASVRMPVLKQSFDKKATVVRLFHAGKGTANATLTFEDITLPVTLGEYEIRSYRLENGNAVLCDLCENPIA